MLKGVIYIWHYHFRHSSFNIFATELLLAAVGSC